MRANEIFSSQTTPSIIQCYIHEQASLFSFLPADMSTIPDRIEDPLRILCYLDRHMRMILCPTILENPVN